MEKALKSAGISLWDIQVLELYDQSTVMEMVSLEDLGFCERGTAWKTIFESCQDYKSYYKIGENKLFVNMNGGLKADGNPLGATGGAQIYEVFKQLRGEAGERQVKDDRPLKYGCVLELEGFGTKGYVHILGGDAR
jgi:acetyl-CoA C-acetyltransferase